MRWINFFFLRQKKRTGKPLKIEADKLSIAPIDKTVIEIPVENIVQEEKIIIPEPVQESETQKIITEENDNTYLKSFSNNFTKHPLFGDENKWLLVSGSAIGKSHIKDKLPCQDNHFCESINDEWGVAISCDGAGSANNSDLGSKFVSSQCAFHFKAMVLKNEWHKKSKMPSYEEWNAAAREVFIDVYNSLKKFAAKEKFEFSSLACTIIVVIYSANGLLVSHIGDGRAGYCNEDGEWKSMITPHKGDEANQTIFITSNRWIKDLEFTMSGMQIPESHVITEKPVAFTLMSDGCEQHSFECSFLNKEANKWFDPNLPYPKFYKPLMDNVKLMYKNNVSAVDANKMWIEFLENGTKGLGDEPDDKTMILGILI
jgi:hypothetical protein